MQPLRSLDSDDFWAIAPLTQPFMLEEGIPSSCQVIHRILKGKITGTLTLEMRKIHYKIHYTEDSSQYTLLKTQATFPPGLVIGSEESNGGLEKQISAPWHEFCPRVPVLPDLSIY